MSYFPAPPEDQLPAHIAAVLVGWARISQKGAWRHPGMPREWTPVLEHDPSEPNRAPLGGWIYIYENRKVREVNGRRLEVVRGPDRPAE